MKILSSVILAIISFSVFIPSVSAYGGGGVTPPAYENPHQQYILECREASRKIFGQKITYPKCKLVKNPEYKKYDRDYRDRLKDFLRKVKKGHD